MVCHKIVINNLMIDALASKCPQENCIYLCMKTSIFDCQNNHVPVTFTLIALVFENSNNR